MAYKISIKAKDDFRSFKKDYEINFEFDETKVNFLMGKNGCGKSTIIQSIRGVLNSNDDKDKRWSAKHDCMDILEHFDVKIEGFNNVYHLDIDGLDDNLSMFNASSATDLVDLGGLGMNKFSQGERTLIMLNRLKQMVKDAEDSVIIFDELDNHLDFDFRIKFVPWLRKLFPLSKKIIITHDLLMTALCEGNIVYIDSQRDLSNLNKCNVTGKEARYYKGDTDKKFFFTIHTLCEINDLTKKKIKRMRVKIEEMDLNEVYRDYKSLKELTEKYYYYANEKLREASEALLKTLLAEANKRTIDELETNYNDNLIAESVRQINKDGENSPYKFKTTEEPCDRVTAPQWGDWEVKVEAKANEEEEHPVPLIKQRDIVYTTDGGKTFKNCSPQMWKYDMGIPVGYVIEVDDTKENNVTICADRVFHNITLYGLNIKSIVDGYVFSTTIFEASNNYDGEKNTELLYESLSDKDTHCALSTIKKYKIEGVDKDAIKWYIPSCGELKTVSGAFASWMERKFDLKPYTSFWTSNISTKDSGWIFGMNSCKPNLTPNMNWDQTLLPFAKVKVVQD